MKQNYTIPDQDFIYYFSNPNSAKCISRIHESTTHTLIDIYDSIFFMFDPMCTTFGSHYGILGCKLHYEKITIKQNEIYVLDFTKIVGDGEVLYINYTPISLTELDQGLFPIELHGNEPLTNIRRKTIHLLPYSKQTYLSPVEGQVQIMMYFAPSELKEDLSTNYMLDAFKYFKNGDHRYAIISAQTAIEIEATRYLSKMAEVNKLNDRAVKYLGDLNSIHKVLFGVIPLLSALLNFQMPNERIMTNIKNLVYLRNALIHNGKIPEGKDFSADRVKNCLVSAFFLYKYFKLDIPSITK